MLNKIIKVIAIAVTVITTALLFTLIAAIIRTKVPDGEYIVFGILFTPWAIKIENIVSAAILKDGKNDS